MTNEQLLERTLALRSQSDKEWHEYLDGLIEVINKQIPRKTYAPSIKCSISVGTCMVCGKSFASIQNYCSWCGQRQDWSNI